MGTEKTLMAGLLMVTLATGACSGARPADGAEPERMQQDTPASTPDEAGASEEAAQEGEEEPSGDEPGDVLGDIVIDGRYIEIDGQEVRHVTCELSDSSGMALLEVVASLAAAKPVLDACAPQGAAFRVELTLGAAPAARVVESSKAPADSCVEAALSGIAAPLEGSCTLVLVVGDKEGARPAADAMAPLEPAATE